ncbi:ABC transporter ATP-binding protein [Sporolactobacillus sp. THM7-7]|nr:ABC transporter ATP-binding protein [Sporolactobacillus sp. THM7-7]
MDRSDIQMSSTISLKGVKKLFERHAVIEDLNLQLKDGEFLSLLGPSGAGKTTILRMIAGLEYPDGGEIRIKSRDVSTVPPNKRNLGMVFQQYALFPHMTVWENVAYGLKARKLKKEMIKEKANKYLALTGLSELASRKPRELSGGQQQRVSLARALAIEPLVMLFDEPLSNLDARLKDQMLQEIHQLHQKLKFTAVYVTHDQNEALFLSDKIAVLNGGKIEQFDRPEMILSQPATAFVADFFGYTNTFASAILKDEHMVSISGVELPVGYTTETPGSSGIVKMRENGVNIVGNEEASGLEPSKAEKSIEAYVIEARYLGSETKLLLRLDQEGEHSFSVKIPQIIRPLPEIHSKINLLINADYVTFYLEE